jgi:tRNA(Ile)-lysidine synthase
MPASDPDLPARLPPAGGYWVAYSGGRDSHVLLHRLAALRERLAAPLGAVHVNHHLNPDADRWAAHCRRQCETLRVPLEVLDVTVDHAAGEGLEAAARAARHQAWAQWLPAGDALLTAHHRDDQAETLLLQLLRGAGPAGLAAMPEISTLAAGLLVRPLLHASRAELAAYAHAAGLRWIDDPSNLDARFDRNYLRHRVVPLLHERWPGLSRTLSRAAGLQAESARLADELGAADYDGAVDAETGALSVTAAQALSVARRNNLLRYWIRASGFATPPQRVLERLVEDALYAAGDAEPCIDWDGTQVRRYRDRLFVMTPLSSPDDIESRRWRILDGALCLAGAGGTLEASPTPGGGIAQRFAETPFELRRRRGGERILPAGGAHHRKVKTLLQERGVPGWERRRLPLLYFQNELAAVPGVAVAEAFSAAAHETGWWPQWSRLSTI